jgi:hypothetical protein
LKVHHDCMAMMDSIDQYQWDLSDTLTRNKPVHNQASHMADALRYALYTFNL